MFMPCMVGAMESQFLKMLVQVNGAKRCLDIGTFTGMSALAMAEGLPADGKVVTLECSENVANVAKKVFAASSVADKIELRLGQAVDALKQMVENGEKFDIIFIDADKENYIEYYELSLQLLGGNGVILADNSLCALLYDQESDVRSSKLHDFNQYVKNDKRTEQVVLTVREGITMIKPV
jgi:caffeoyl-CoA O-methyltransferase